MNILSSFAKADDTRGNFLNNFVLLGHFPIENGWQISILDWLLALCLTWLAIDGNIAQNVAPCIISLILKLFQTCIKVFPSVKHKRKYFDECS